METTKEIEQEFLTQIETEIEFCDAQTTPVICSNLADAESKAALVRTIAKVCLEGKMTISQAIVQTEQLYSINDID